MPWPSWRRIHRWRGDAQLDGDPPVFTAGFLMTKQPTTKAVRRLALKIHVELTNSYVSQLRNPPTKLPTEFAPIFYFTNAWLQKKESVDLFAETVF